MNYEKILAIFVSSLLFIQCQGKSGSNNGSSPAPAQLVSSDKGSPPLQSSISTVLNSVVDTLSTGIQQITGTGSANTVASTSPVSSDTSLPPGSLATDTPVTTNIVTNTLTSTVLATSSVTATGTIVATNSTTSTSTGVTIDPNATPGTASNPYPIRTVADLLTVPNYTTSSTYFIQMQNIDLTGVVWTPIPLYGNYNGNGYSIQNLSINVSAATTDVALFSSVNAGASVSYLNVSNVNLVGTTNVGALVSQLLGGTVDHCTSSGSISILTVNTGTLFNGGGLVGTMTSGTISNSSSSVSIINNVSSNYNMNIFSIGGLVGRFTSGSSPATLINSFATGSLSTPSGLSIAKALYVGGLAGFVQSNSAPFTIQNSYTTSNQAQRIQTSNSTTPLGYGGLIGYMSSRGGNNLVDGCFANTLQLAYAAISTANMGGLVGTERSSGGSILISNSYTMGTLTYAGTISPGSNVGGFVGYADSYLKVNSSYVALASLSATAAPSPQGFMGVGGTVTNSYLYQNPNVPASSIGGVTTYTQSWQMQSQANFPGFTFGQNSNNWTMPKANLMSPSLLSPVLFWQCGNNGVQC